MHTKVCDVKSVVVIVPLFALDLKAIEMSDGHTFPASSVHDDGYPAD